MIIAIDGPSGTGKSTVAKGVAKRLGFTFFDTGAMYRSFAWMLLQEGVDPDNRVDILEALTRFHYDIRLDDAKEKCYFVNGTDVTGAIRTQHISAIASKIAVIPEVRKNIVQIQREFGHQAHAVFEGRDMGTVVFPDADLKIFLTARSEIRAERRYQDLLHKFPDLSASLNQKQIEEEIEQRDKQDTTRAVSPLRQANDAFLIDTSEMSAEEVIEKIVQLFENLPAVKKFPKMRFLYRICILFAKAYFKLFFRLKTYGLEHVRPGSGILASNHTSYLDPSVVSVSVPEEVHFLAKESLFRVPLLGRLIRILNSHPVSRDASDAATFRQIVAILKSGKKVILFPEGRRSKSGQLQPIEKGLAFLVYKTKCSIFPVYVHGTYEAWGAHSRLPKLWGRIVCVFGSPIEWESFAGLEKKVAQEQITKRYEEAILALKQWFDSGAIGTPP